MTKDEIVDQVLDAVAGGFYKSGWSYTAQIIEQEKSSQRKEVAAALAPIAERMAAESRELDEPTSEKARRVYYQDIVYSVCSVLDEIDGRKAGSGIICGTAETPSTEVQDRMKRLLAEWRNRATTTEPSKPSLEAALAVVRDAVVRAGQTLGVYGYLQTGDVFSIGGCDYETAEHAAKEIHRLASERHDKELAAAQARYDAARKAFAEAMEELARVKGGVE